MIHIRAAWDDYFTGTPNNLNSQTYSSRQTPSGTSIHISNCLFLSFTSTSDGGALYCNSATYFLVESTSFFSCKTSDDWGGAIYFYNSGGQCAFYDVCGYDCYSTYTGTSYGQFVYAYVNNAASSKNYVNYSSVALCVNVNSNSYSTLRHGCGKICCTSVNSSLNKCYYYSGIHCYPFNDLNAFICSLSYSSFADNIANGYTCVLLWTSNAKYEIRSCNILRNTQVDLNSYATIATIGNTVIEDSCILENKATCIFYQQSSSCTITISNCTVDSTSKSGTVITQNTVTKSFILALNHMSTLNCHSEYDSAGYLTPIIQTPSPSKKQKQYCSCDKFLLQLRQSDIVSLMSILVFNFIHPYASGYPLY
jgi:hypothetical protein